MANPGKQYQLPCHIDIEYGMAGPYFAFIEYVRLGRKKYQINAYKIDIEVDDSYEQFLFEQECGSGDDY